MEEKISNRIQKIESFCKEKSGRKLQKNAMPIREAVVVIKENTTMLELQNLAKKLEEELKIRIFQIVIHKDEGHYDKDTQEWKPNFHAHLVADWQDLETGKTLKHQSFHYSKMQDLAAECLEMERGVSGSISRLEAVEFKIKKKEEDLSVLEDRYSEMVAELNSKNFEELIVKEPDFLGFQKMKTEKTLMNMEKAYKIQASQIIKNKSKLESNSKHIDELTIKIVSLKKEVQVLKTKNSALLTNETVFASEKKKYLDSVTNLIEKSIRNEHLKVSFLERQKLESFNISDEISRICTKVSQENHIPFSAFEEIFKDYNNAAYFLNIMKFGHGKTLATKQNSTKITTEPTETKNEQIEKRKRLRR
ncbi:MAG: hypothetical protein RSN61_19115 [Chryseobacterium sp.]|uniref:hypothetical protein n=2 Tax=Flavobacteriales TaxID=200644 RepID=UPI002FC773E0